MSGGNTFAGDRYMTNEEFKKLDKKQKAEHLWLSVMEKKQQNTDTKKKHIKELLNRKFKHERKGQQSLKERQEDLSIKAEQNAEKLLTNLERKKFEENKREQSK